MSTCIIFAVLLTAVSALAPKGMMMFFTTEHCPPGWSELENTKGRLIVSVTDPALGGVTVNQPLADREVRQHSHDFSAAYTVPSRNVAAIGCCNNQGALSGTYSVNNASGVAGSNLPMVQLILCRLEASDTANEVSFATVAYFSPSVSECPSHWQPFNMSAGRFMVPSGENWGDAIPNRVPALSSGEDGSVHTHNFNVSFATYPVSYEGVDGCCNNAPSAQSQVTISGTTEPASAGLPYVQLLTCVSQVESFNATLPSGALLFSEIGCPNGWSNALDMIGTMLVSLPEDGRAYSFFGGASLTPGRDCSGPRHHHELQCAVDLPSTGVGLASGCCAGGYAAAGSYEVTGNTAANHHGEYPMLFINLCVSQN